MENLYEAYLDVYERYQGLYQSPQPTHNRLVSQNPQAMMPPGRRAMEKSDQLQRTEPGSKREKSQTRKALQMQRHFQSARRVSEEVETDLFDYLLEYLVAEGYADTNDNAIAIMANMSEAWKEEILDEAYQEPRFNRKHYLKKLSKRGGMGMGTPEDPHGYRDPKMAKVGAEFSKRKTAAAKAKKTGEPDTYRAEKEAQSKNR